jgi:hypothetical protein
VIHHGSGADQPGIGGAGLLVTASLGAEDRRFLLGFADEDHAFGAFELAKETSLPAPSLVRSAIVRQTSSIQQRQSVTYIVHNATRSTTIGDRIARAGTSNERTTGLLKRSKLENGEGLWIIPCEAVHTFFMKFPLDLIYIDRKHRIRKVVRNVAPWRVSACLSAHSIIELPAGMIDETDSQPGDQLEINPV